MTTSTQYLSLIFRHLAYSLEPIGWDFESLTEDEKMIFQSQEMLDNLKGYCFHLGII